MKYIVNRNGSQFVETTKNHRPIDAIVEYTGQVAEDELPYTTITDGPLDEFGQPTKVFTVDTVAKTADETAQAVSEAHEAKISLVLSKQQFGARIKAEIAVINDGKNWTVGQTISYMANVTIKDIDPLLTAGSLASASNLISTSDLSAYYTNAEKTYITDMITAFLA
jgi:hypothetical protein